MSIITLTTDFGVADPFVGIMKGVILGIAPGAAMVDLTHEVPPQDIMAGALALEAAIEYFPHGTVHLAVVDPGVGSDRASVAIKCERFTLVGPDNGLFSLVLARHPMREAVSLTKSEYHLKPLSATFHGRDIFAPAAAHLANGIPIEELGELITELRGLNLPEPVAKDRVMEIHILYVDRFGNLVTDLMSEDFERWAGGIDPRNLRFRVGNYSFVGLSRTYSDVLQQEPAAYFGSGRRLEIAIRDGRADERFQADRVTTASISLPTDAKPT